MMGLSALAGRRRRSDWRRLLAAEYTWVMWNRAALMESTMTRVHVVAGGRRYALGSKRPIWGFVAGRGHRAGVVLPSRRRVLRRRPSCWDALVTLAASTPGLRSRLGMSALRQAPTSAQRLFTLAGMAVAFGRDRAGICRAALGRTTGSTTCR
jgi:hypothetical protein